MIEDRTALEESVGAMLDALHEDAPEVTDTPEVTVDSSEPEVETPAPVDDEVTLEGQEAAAEESAPTLPDAHIRSLKAYGYSDEDIEEGLASGPAFSKMAEKVHLRRTADAAEWAKLGRAVAGQQAPVQQAYQQPVPQQQQPYQLQPLDAAKLREKYGNDELIDELVGPVNGTIAAIQSMMPVISQSMARAQQNEQEAVGRQLEGFFQDGPLKGYDDVYGKTFADAEPVQAQRRIQVLTMADAMIAGARYQGRAVSAGEALELAHAAVSNEFVKTKTRQELKDATTKRAASMTTRPTKLAATPVSDEAVSRVELEARTAKRLAALRDA